jgi:hypothetical protein
MKCEKKRVKTTKKLRRKMRKSTTATKTISRGRKQHPLQTQRRSRARFDSRHRRCRRFEVGSCSSGGAVADVLHQAGEGGRSNTFKAFRLTLRENRGEMVSKGFRQKEKHHQ